jgi:hypothetical protein
MWTAEVFLLSLPAMFLAKTVGDVGLFDVHTKCSSLFIGRFMQIRNGKGTADAEWFLIRNRVLNNYNPPDMRVIPSRFNYL